MPGSRVLVGVGLVVALVLCQPVAAATTSAPGVLPRHSHPHGLTYEQWSTRWWRPFFEGRANDPRCSVKVAQTRRVWLLGAAGELGKSSRSCSVPSGTMLFFAFPFAGWCDTTPTLFGLPGASTAELRDCAVASFHEPPPPTFSASIDGRRIRSLHRYEVVSPQFRFTLGEGNFLQAPPGTYRAVGDGVFLMFAPRGVGIHVFHWRAEIPFAFEDSTYRIRVLRR
jgi:hypothetical protein